MLHNDLAQVWNFSSPIGKGILREERCNIAENFRVEGKSKTLFEFSITHFVAQNLTGNRNWGELVIFSVVPLFSINQWQMLGSSSQDDIAMSKLLIGKIIVGSMTIVFFVILKMLVIGVVLMSC